LQHRSEYTKWSAVLKAKYGERVQKISLDVGAGCPHRDEHGNGGCIFCDIRGGGSGAWLESVSLEEQISKGAEIARRRYHAWKSILYFQSYTSTNLPLALLKERVEKAISIAGDLTEVVGIALGTRPDMVPDGFVDFLLDLAVRGYEVWLELGVQSIDEKALKWLNRGHGLACVEEIMSKVAPMPISVCAHLISGMPDEREDQLAISAEWLVDRGVKALKFHPLHVLKDTALERYYLEGNYLPISMDEYARRVAKAIRSIPSQTIIQRLSADARYPWLIAPDWILRKNDVIKTIERYLAAK